MNDEMIIRVLPLLFRHTHVPKNAKERLRARLFRNNRNNALSDDDLSFVAAAGDPAETMRQAEQIKNEEK
jgi:hypothetical protein